MKYGIVFASMFAAAAAFADVFDAAVWRGETAYVEIPEALRDKAEPLPARRTCVFVQVEGDRTCRDFREPE